MYYKKALLTTLEPRYIRKLSGILTKNNWDKKNLLADAIMVFNKNIYGKKFLTQSILNLIGLS